ncbi:acetyltransferase [Xylariomycetidae sp. FL2044]|nr:acetyltransferase [Xylariomycetidae sp. FL2044]
METATTHASQGFSIPATAILSTDKCFIRPFEMEDAPALAHAADDRELAKMMRDRFPSPYTLEDAKSWINLCQGSTSTLNFGIFTLSGTYAGSIGLEARQPDVAWRTRELGYFLGKQHRSQGIASSAVTAFTRWAFQQLPELLRIEATVFEGNTASESVLRRAGFVKEGIKRAAVFKNGVVLDQPLFSLIRKDLER